MSAFKNDGTIPYGSKVLTLNAVTYVAENIELSFPSAVILRTNELGEPSGQVCFNPEPRQFTCTLQLATTSTAMPVKGTSASAITFDSVTGAETFFLYEVGMSFTQNGETKVPATFRKLIN